MSVLLRWSAYLALAGVALTLAGAGYERWASARDLAAHPPPGALVSVGDVTLHIDCRGAGSPVVLLEAGLGMDSTGWYKVHDELAAITQTCAYDRAGRGWSSPGDARLSSELVNGRLEALLAAAVREPVLLVGMSAGGVFVRDYFARHPREVVGMVLVDSSHEGQRRRLPEFPAGEDLTDLIRLCAWLQPLGIVRLLSSLDGFYADAETPAEQRAIALANAYRSHSCRALLLESEGFEAELVAGGSPPDLGDLPLIVLSQGNEPEADEELGLSEDWVMQQRAAWDVLQEELALLSTRGKRIVARQAGHLIQIDQPQIVIDSISDLVLELRAEGSRRPPISPG